MKKAIDTLLNYTNKLILIFSGTAFIIALIGAVFFCVNRSYDYLNPILLITGAIVYFFLVVRLYKFTSTLNTKSNNTICVILLVLQFAILFTVTQVVTSIPKVDLIHILTEINSLNDTGSILNGNYYSVYPNNKFILMLLYGISKISESNSGVVFGLLSSACVSVTTIFTYLTVRTVSDSTKALTCLFICVFSPIFYLYAPYYYTDILMLPFAGILIYLCIRNDRETKLWKNILYSAATGIIAIIGYKIRAVSIFILIAYFVYLVISKKFKVLGKSIVPIMLAAVLTLGVINSVENRFFTDIDTSKQFPATHWIMMGLNEESNGYYSQDDYDLSSSADKVKDRTALNINEIKNRTDELGFGGILKLMVKKIYTVWGKGDYSYQKYLELSGDYNSVYPYLIEDENILLNYILQINKIGVLTLSLVALYRLLKQNKSSIVAIALFGAILFYLGWEVCPRYGLSFLPWMILLSCYSFDGINYNYDRSRLCRYLKYITVLTTVVVLCVGFFTSTVPEQRSSIVAKDTVKKVKYISLDKDTVLTQSLDLYREFDELKLKFRINGSALDDRYRLELIDDLGVTVYQREFTVQELNDKKYTSFKLDDRYPEGKYSLRLSSYNDNGADIYISYKECFDYYPEGNLRVNGNAETGDMMFEVKSTEIRPLYSIGGYILLCVIILGTEYFVLLKKEENENE